MKDIKKRTQNTPKRTLNKYRILKRLRNKKKYIPPTRRNRVRKTTHGGVGNNRAERNRRLAVGYEADVSAPSDWVGYDGDASETYGSATVGQTDFKTPQTDFNTPKSGSTEYKTPKSGQTEYKTPKTGPTEFFSAKSPDDKKPPSDATYIVDKERPSDATYTVDKERPSDATYTVDKGRPSEAIDGLVKSLSSKDESSGRRFILVRISLPDGNVMDVQGDPYSSIEETVNQMKQDSFAKTTVPGYNNRIASLEDSIGKINNKLDLLLQSSATPQPGPTKQLPVIKQPPVLPEQGPEQEQGLPEQGPEQEPVLPEQEPELEPAFDQIQRAATEPMIQPERPEQMRRAATEPINMQQEQMPPLAPLDKPQSKEEDEDEEPVPSLPSLSLNLEDDASLSTTSSTLPDVNDLPINDLSSDDLSSDISGSDTPASQPPQAPQASQPPQAPQASLASLPPQGSQAQGSQASQGSQDDAPDMYFSPPEVDANRDVSEFAPDFDNQLGLFAGGMGPTDLNPLTF